MAAVIAWPAVLRERLRWMRWQPFDQSTAEGRAMERHRRVAMTAAAAALAKLLSVGTALISIPLTLHYLGAERFGLWMTISSLIAMLAFADFGIANGVLSVVAGAHGRDDQPGIRRAVSSGWFLLVGIGAVVLGLFALLYGMVPWERVFNVSSSAAVAEAGPALAVFMLCFACNIPLGVVQRVQMGLQQGFVASLWQCLGSLCALVGVLVAIRLQLGLPWLVAALAGAPLAAAMLNGIHFFLWSRTDLRPRLREVCATSCRTVAATGALFFLLQLVGAVAYTSDSIVIAQLLGASAVAEYAVPEKMFGLLTLAMGMVLAPLWPAYGEAIARGDAAWVRRTLRRSITIAMSLVAVAALALLALGPTLIHLWVRDAVVPAFGLLVALAAWKVVEVGGNALAMFLNGARVISLQVWCAIPTALAALALKVALVPSLGAAGAVWASLLAYVACTALPVGLRLPTLLRELSATGRH